MTICKNWAFNFTLDFTSVAIYNSDTPKIVHALKEKKIKLLEQESFVFPKLCDLTSKCIYRIDSRSSPEKPRAIYRLSTE